MIFEQLYLGCLAQASYFIGSDGAAAVVDPRRDVDDYLMLAERHGLKITHVILSHIHADFVAGHTELAKRAGARICLSHRAACGFDRQELRDGDVLAIGRVALEILETPGHTPTDICILLRDGDAPDRPAKLLTGDTLFLGDVGRPDLAGSTGFSAADMAGMMYDSLRAKILPLADEIEVFPGHGAGSACGRNISTDRSSTIGQQRFDNHALQPITREQFIETLIVDRAAPPPYFSRAAALNSKGPVALTELEQLSPLATDDVGSAQLLDPRGADDFGRGHLPGAINIGLAGQFESWCGAVLDLDHPVVLTTEDEASAQSARLRLARIGIEDVLGYVVLDEKNRTAKLPQLGAAELGARIEANKWQIVDVRHRSEFESGRAPGAVHVPLTILRHDASRLDGLDRSCPTAIICGSGYRSSAAAHFLTAAGFEQLYNVSGGTNAWRDAGLPLEH